MNQYLESLADRVSGYKRQPTTQPYEQKVDALEAAIDSAVSKTPKDRTVHLGYSGGVDSSLILMKLLQTGTEVVAHTIGSREGLPDIVHARRFVAKLNLPNLEHVVTLMEVTKEDVDRSNEILSEPKNRPDNYYMLMKAVSQHTDRLVTCDVIDELAGGYYMHQNPQKLPCFSHRLSDVENRSLALNHFMSWLVEGHLSPLGKCSQALGVDVFLPYGEQTVMDCMSRFTVPELVDDVRRKKPIYDLAKRNKVSSDVLQRRKYGLVSALVG